MRLCIFVAAAFLAAPLGEPLGAQQEPFKTLERERVTEKLLERKLVTGQELKEKHRVSEEKLVREKLRDDMTIERKFKEKAYEPSLDWPRQSPSFHPEDPADSAYRAAYQLFSRQEYRAAADRFSELRAKFPTTRYLCDASYFEAFSRYRIGTPADLRTARKVLDGMGASCTSASRLKDVPELLARVDGALARLGDNDASERLRRAASEGRAVCDREERNVKIQALSALAQMDGEGARPILERVLAQKDECSAPVRREALQLVARNADAAVVPTLLRSARNDPDPETRGAAVEVLGRINADPAYAAIEELLRTSTDEHVQVSAVRAMSRSDSPRAQATVRALAERQDVSERLRASVIGSMGEKGGTPVEYWRTLYGKVESDELRRAVVNAVDRTTPDGVAFLVRIGGDAAQPSSVRAAAISRVRQTASVADLYKLFETADSRSIRQAIVSGLASRKEPEATDRLIDIAKRGTDPEVRAAAIRYLGQPARRDDPKVRKALADILGGQS
jgi:HEAT repeat protein